MYAIPCAQNHSLGSAACWTGDQRRVRYVFLILSLLVLCFTCKTTVSAGCALSAEEVQQQQRHQSSLGAAASICAHDYEQQVLQAGRLYSQPINASGLAYIQLKFAAGRLAHADTSVKAAGPVACQCMPACQHCDNKDRAVKGLPLHSPAHF